MKWLKLATYLVAIAVLTGSGSGQPAGSWAPAALAQSSDAGAFGQSEANWDASFTFVEERSDGFLVYQLNDGSSVYVRLGSQGLTTYVEYELSGSLSFSDTERFVTAELLPDDASRIAEYEDVLVGGDGPIIVQLYESNAVGDLGTGSSNIILVAYGPDGDSFSASIE